MQHDWIMDVLADLKTFAKANDLTALTEQLDDTILVAAAEIASKASEVHAQTHGEQGQPGPDRNSAGGHQRA